MTHGARGEYPGPMILQLAAENRYGRGHTFTDIRSLRAFVKDAMNHPAGPAALAKSVFIFPAASAEFALNALPVTPATVIIHGENAEAIGASLRASRGTSVIVL